MQQVRKFGIHYILKSFATMKKFRYQTQIRCCKGFAQHAIEDL